MGLHQDKDEDASTLDAGVPVVSLSIGDSARFLLGGFRRRDPVAEIMLRSGDAFVMGGPGRLRYHGVARILPASGSPGLGLEGTDQPDVPPVRAGLTLRATAGALPRSRRLQLPDPAVALRQQIELPGGVDPQARVHPVAAAVGVGVPGHLDEVLLPAVQDEPEFPNLREPTGHEVVRIDVQHPARAGSR